MNFSFLNNRLKVVLCLIVLYCTVSEAKTQTQSDSVFYSLITNAIIEGNADELSALFHSKVDLTLPGQNNIYSKYQAKFILKDFFLKHRPDSFNLVNQNKIDDSSFIVGKLHTAEKHYRVCFLTKTISNVIYIYQIRIEE